ncbi:hypothetical protein L7F22_028857 [Adiantum nelumboides]|nr:hypothetical protein [Adiantum nelumboides]
MHLSILISYPVKHFVDFKAVRTMVGITEAMLKRRAEHNDGILYTLEELVLQEEGLDRIDKTLGTLCPHLKHLYMPNNLIPRIENLSRLKELQYLNLALNNITKVYDRKPMPRLARLPPFYYSHTSFLEET